jgi:DNA-binding CsgD family transcriptional regulator
MPIVWSRPCEPRSGASGDRRVETEYQDRIVTAMAQNNSRFIIPPSPSRFDIAAEKLSRLRAELTSEARRRGVDDIGVAMTQLSQPLAALLLYLHAIKQTSKRSDGAEIVPASVCEIVDMALREAERVCEILDRTGQSVETPVDAETALARGREAIDSWVWIQNSHASAARPASPAASVVGQYSLTPRERQVLELITGGASNKEGGYRLGISTRTFEAHRAHLMGKLGTRNAADLVRVALAAFAHSPPIGAEDQVPAPKALATPQVTD